MDRMAKTAPSIESTSAETQKVINKTNTTKEAKSTPNVPCVSVDPDSENNACAQIPPNINAITDNMAYTTEPI